MKIVRILMVMAFVMCATFAIVTGYIYSVNNSQIAAVAAVANTVACILWYANCRSGE